MIFRITGADSKTGADRTICLRAEDERHALALAKEHGIHPYQAERDKAAERAEAERTRLAEEEDRVRREEADRLQRIRREEADRLQRIHDRIAQIKGTMRTRLEAGQAVFLYETTYLPVDSMLLDEKLNNGFDIPQLRLMGIAGWEVMQVIPRTMGVGLKNNSIGSTMGTTWGGGSGGNVIGVHVILKKAVRLEDISDDPDDEVGVYIRSNLGSFKRA
jgi:hypothetical protein